MKKIIVLLMAICMMASYADAQSRQDARKAYEMERKAAEKSLSKKSIKAARKEAKKFKKEGWLVPIGALPLDKQLERSYIMAEMIGDEMLPKYFAGSGNGVGGSFTSAKTQADLFAKQDIAGQLQTEVVSLLEASVANKQLSNTEAASITEVVMASKQLIVQSLNRALPVIEVYRDLGNGNTEVMYRCYYDREAAKQTTLDIIKGELEQKSGKLHEKLDRLAF